MGHLIRWCAGAGDAGLAVRSAGRCVRVFGEGLAGLAVALGSGGAGGSATTCPVGLLAAGGGAVHGEPAGAGQGAG